VKEHISLYPLQFTPILKEKVWGGSQLKEVLQKTDQTMIGESWELSGVPDNISKVCNGQLQGNTLQELISEYGNALMGEKVLAAYGDQFPLLFKFIDAAKDLSVQVHPDDVLAKRRHDCFGKTEMWYIMHTRPEARLVLGFDPIMDEDSYQTHVAEGTLTEILNNEPVSAGDAFFIPPGTVHAIGSGVLLAEIQQTSDVTYRIFDWNRPDAQGNFRELHTEEALDAIDFSPFDARISYQDVANKPVVLASNEYFETRKWKLDTTQRIAAEERDSFTVWMCVEGNAIIKTQTSKISLSMGATVLIPACLKSYQIETTGATLLEVYIP
tara:strand:- start:1110 stop:2087 length:978 start_codon:yes stop_codon:yes gene_type:complete